MAGIHGSAFMVFVYEKIKGRERELQSKVSVNRSDHEADWLEGVETSSILCPKDSILKFAAVNPPTVPYTIQVGLTTGIIPPATLMEVRTIT